MSQVETNMDGLTHRGEVLLSSSSFTLSACFSLLIWNSEVHSLCQVFVLLRRSSLYSASVKSALCCDHMTHKSYFFRTIGISIFPPLKVGMRNCECWHGMITPAFRNDSKTGVMPLMASVFNGYCCWQGMKSDTGSADFIMPTSCLP